MEQLNLQLISPNANIVNSSFSTPEQALEDILTGFLPNSKDESRIQKSRKILGESAKGQSDDQIQTFCTQMQYLIDTWLDSYEQEIFEGSTLKQLLGKG